MHSSKIIIQKNQVSFINTILKKIEKAKIKLHAFKHAFLFKIK